MKRTAPIFARATLLAGAVIVGSIGGAAWMSRGPDPVSLPDMVGPLIAVSDQPIWVQKYEVSVAEWNACFAAGACSQSLTLRPDQDAQGTPATNLSYPDVQEYLSWMHDLTGTRFRLLRVAEWNILAEGVVPKTPDPIFSDPALSWASDYLNEAGISRALKPRGSFSTSADGLVDLNGSVWEWTADCYAGTGAPAGRCPAFFVTGEHVAAMAYQVRDPARGGCATGAPPAHLGMRLVSDTPPPSR